MKHGRLIDADALMPRLEFIREAEHQIFYGKESWGFVSKCITAVEDAPTIEERKTGKWIDQKGGGCCCSECGRYALDEVDGNFIHVAAKSNFCPNCGADMRMR